jgi:hypothetical protein
MGFGQRALGGMGEDVTGFERMAHSQGGCYI